ncbi:P-loop containing nucleoside triphosphate hydrolase protein [Lyophyllum atratum]|nr:P-loop containing nucleoside triphosphate hydrolase protein [Lyophyllum atratum]
MDAGTQTTEFIARQRLLLKKERDAEITRSSLLLSNCGPKLLEQKGLSLGGLGIVGVNIGLGGKTLVELERPTAYHTNPAFPPHTIRAGDLARIEANVVANAAKKAKKTATEETKGSQPEGVVYKVSDTRIVIAVDSSDTAAEDLDLPERCRVVKLANSVTYDRMDKALDRLEKRVTGPKDDKASVESIRLTQVLLGMVPRSEKQPVQDLRFFDESLNASQKEAIKFCLESPEVACIHGPPGTGKTHTLIELIRQLTTVSSYNPKPLKLLVCGASNLSVDNILERLLDLPPGEKGEKLKVTRIGHPARVMAHERILDSTLEVKATRTDQAALAKDVKNELEETLGVLSGKGKGAKGKRPKGGERKKLWDEVKALRKEYRQREGGVVKSVLSESQIVLATCHSAGGRQLYNHDFDVLIIDEATQALEAVCWIPIFKAKKLILAGDPMQLPPTILSINDERKRKAKDDAAKSKRDRASPVAKLKQANAPPSQVPDDTESDSESSAQGDVETSLVEATTALSIEEPATPQKIRQPVVEPPRTLETTLFDRLEKMYGSSIKRMLNVQYRMHSQICAFPSKVLYSSKLTSHTSVEGHLLQDLSNTHADTEDDEKEMLATPVVFFDTAGCEYFERLEGDGDEGSRCNENEATVVKNWVEKLVEVGLTPDQIAVITPYQAQVTLLSSLLRPMYGTNLEIGSVDGMQGREKEAVIISLVRSNETREVGFLKEKRRLNVAMTRAKRHLCVVGDSSTVCHGGSYLKKWLAWLDTNADVKYAGLE